MLAAKADAASTAHPLRMTALHAAAIAGHHNVCVVLLKAGAPAATCGSFKWTPSMWAARREHKDKELAHLMDDWTDEKPPCSDHGSHPTRIQRVT
jgi:ankyrin repeat protein